MKRSKTIIDFFKVQDTNLSCPACGILITKSKLNIHLDSECPSSVPISKTFNNISSSSNGSSSASDINHRNKKRMFSKGASKIYSSKTSRLSLKHQKINADKTDSVKAINLVNAACVMEPEIITLDDDLSLCTTNVINVENNFFNVAINKDNVSSFEQRNDNSTSIINSEIKLHSSVCIKETGNSQTEMINVEKCLSFKKERTESLKSFITTKKQIINDCQIFATEKNESTKQELLPDSQCTILSDSSVGVVHKDTNKIRSNNDFKANADALAVLNDAEEFFVTDDNVFTENSENKGQSESYSPYYIANFKHILKDVLKDDFNKNLFNDEDMTFVKVFEASSDSAQKLYVRLFQRKYKWLRLNKINYPNITNNPATVLDELVKVGLIDLGSNNIDLETALDLLFLPEARNIAKQFKFNLSGKSKTDITHKLLKHSKEHKSVFFCNGKNSISNMMLNRVKDTLGPCYRISILPKRLFTRILMLFSLPTISEDDEDAAGGQHQQLLTLLQVNKGELTFPDYKVNREVKIFSERDELIRYEEAKQLENDILNAIEYKNFELAKELYITAKDEFETQLTCPFAERAASLPTFLKKYTSFHVYVRCMTQGVEILQKLRQYKEAVDLLKRLLDQEAFCQDYHGRWWDRMALNLEQHLKQRQQALNAIKKGLKDPNVRAGHHYSLLTRALRILKSVDETDEFKNKLREASSVIEAPKTVIRGRLCPRNILGRRHVFISSSSALTDEDDITVLGVEELAIEHYKSEGFTEGIHGEGSTFHSLYGLLFWDIIYDGDIPDAFISPYQTHPLDLNHDSFFIRRKKQIINHLENLRASTIEELKEIIKSSWIAHFGQTSLVVWCRFRDVEHVLGLASCMGIDFLCGICERLARDFRFTRSGVPDLVVWNPESLQVKIVEVKGPGDKLSSKQILWLDYLLKLGAQAEVCHVEESLSKIITLPSFKTSWSSGSTSATFLHGSARSN